MFDNWFAVVMTATFISAVATMLVGVAGLSSSDPAHGARSTRLMALRVVLCFALLVQIIVYVLYFK